MTFERLPVAPAHRFRERPKLKPCHSHLWGLKQLADESNIDDMVVIELAHGGFMGIPKGEHLYPLRRYVSTERVRIGKPICRLRRSWRGWKRRTVNLDAYKDTDEAIA